MKKVLLGSTALVAAGLISGTALADVELGLGGRYMGAAGVIFDEDFSASAGIDESEVRGYVFKQDDEVYFSGSTVLDNGLEVGARIELEGQTSGDQIDAVFAWFRGGFGEIRFGDTGEALGQLCYLVPSASGIFGADSPNFNFSNAGLAGYGATNGTCYGVDDKSTKIIYFSPTFGGFHFAASFTPDNTEDSRNTLNGAATRLDNNTGQNSENVSIAATFEQDFNGVSLVLGGGATWSFSREGQIVPSPADPQGFNDDEREEYNAYAQVGFSGFTIGGAASARVNPFGDGGDALVYGAGITYNWDAWTVGFGWTHGDYELLQPGSFVGAAPALGDIDQRYDIFALTASYALGPGIQIDGVLEYNDSEVMGNGLGGGGSSGPDYSGFAMGLGTLISF